MGSCGGGWLGEPTDAVASFFAGIQRLRDKMHFTAWAASHAEDQKRSMQLSRGKMLYLRAGITRRRDGLHAVRRRRGAAPRDVRHPCRSDDCCVGNRRPKVAPIQAER